MQKHETICIFSISMICKICDSKILTVNTVDSVVVPALLIVSEKQDKYSISSIKFNVRVVHYVQR